MAKVVAIGNGPSALNELGHIIDQYDDVVRFNQWQTQGYEEHVGTKVTIWAVNSQHEVRGSVRRRQGLTLNRFIHIGNNASDELIDKTTKTLLEYNPTTFIDRAPQDMLLRVKEKMGYWATTGIYTILHLLNTGHTVDLYGFDIAYGDKRAQKGHYFPEQGAGIHNLRKEYEIIRPYFETNQLRILEPSQPTL